MGLTNEQTLCSRLSDDGTFAIFIWRIGDIIDRAKSRDIKINEEQAKSILLNIVKYWDAEAGINWNSIDDFTDYYLGN